MFIPLGLYLAILGLNCQKAVVIGTALSIALEVLQYIFGVGASDITDVITNTLGTAVGAGTYASLSIIMCQSHHIKKLRRIIFSSK